MNIHKFNQRSALRNVSLGRDYAEFEDIIGQNITVAITEIPPYVMIKKHPDGGIKRIEGYLAELWGILEKELGFTTILVEIKEGYLGSSKNGTWNGMIGELQKQRVDVGLANFGINSERKKVIDFSSAIDFDASQLLLFSKGKEHYVDWLTFVTVFSWEIWSFLVGLWIVSSLFLGFASRKEEDKINFLDSGFHLFSAIASQGSDVIPKGASARIIFISFWFMSVVLNASFTALITTNLTTATYRPLRSLEEAFERGYRVSVVSGSQQQLTILASVSEIFRRVSDQLDQDPSLVVDDLEAGIQSTLSGEILFLYNSNMVGYLISRNCSYKLQPPQYFPGYLHVAFRKHFPFREVLNHRIIRLMSSGIQDRLATTWANEDKGCISSGGEVPSLGLSKTIFAFIIVLLGIASSVTILVIEISVERLLRRTFATSRIFSTKTN